LVARARVRQLYYYIQCFDKRAAIIVIIYLQDLIQSIYDNSVGFRGREPAPTAALITHTPPNAHLTLHQVRTRLRHKFGSVVVISATFTWDAIINNSMLTSCARINFKKTCTAASNLFINYYPKITCIYNMYHFKGKRDFYLYSRVSRNSLYKYCFVFIL